MKVIIFPLFETLSLAQSIEKLGNFELGNIAFHQFPDEEINVTLKTDVKNRDIVFLASLDRPNTKLLPLLFAAETALDLGAKTTGLIAPYLAYMRQDKRFNPGESITSTYFAKLLSGYFNWLITVDPHLHRRKSLNDIYTIPATALHATDQISAWIKKHVHKPLIIGPDMESEQWIVAIANNVHAPYVISEKVREGDQVVKVTTPEMSQYRDNTPVLIDDIISTGKTMLQTIEQLKTSHIHAPVCIGVHAVFSEDSYEALLKSGASKVVTCNTIEHASNEIDLSQLIALGAQII